MSLETRLASLISAIGADIKAIATAKLLPNRIGSTFETIEDFTGAITGRLPNVVSGTSAAITSIANPDTSSAGVVQFTTGTTATGRAAIRSNPSVIVFGRGQTLFSTRIRIPVLSTSTNRFQIRCGFGDTDTGDHVDGVYFEYDDSLSPNWRTKSSNNSVRTAINSTVVVAVNTWYKLDIEINAAGTVVTFSINGAVVATHNSVNGINVPTALGRETGYGIWMIKSVGTTACLALFDWVSAQINFSTARAG